MLTIFKEFYFTPRDSGPFSTAPAMDTTEKNYRCGVLLIVYPC